MFRLVSLRTPLVSNCTLFSTTKNLRLDASTLRRCLNARTRSHSSDLLGTCLRTQETLSKAKGTPERQFRRWRIADEYQWHGLLCLLELPRDAAQKNGAKVEVKEIRKWLGEHQTNACFLIHWNGWWNWAYVNQMVAGFDWNKIKSAKKKEHKHEDHLKYMLVVSISDWRTLPLFESDTVAHTQEAFSKANSSSNPHFSKCEQWVSEKVFSAFQKFEDLNMLVHLNRDFKCYCTTWDL